MNVCSLSRFESKCFLTPRVHSIAVALLALTEAYMLLLLKALKRHNSKFRMEKAKIRLTNKHLFTYSEGG